jgi:hypothetical protein
MIEAQSVPVPATVGGVTSAGGQASQSDPTTFVPWKHARMLKQSQRVVACTYRIWTDSSYGAAVECSSGRTLGWQHPHQKSRMAIKLCRAQSPAHRTTRSSPHGVYKPTKNTSLGQVGCPAARRPWPTSVLWARAADAGVCGPGPRCSSPWASQA